MTASLASLKTFAANLKRLPTVVAQKVAAASAPAITSAALTTFDAGEDPYGASWAPGADGSRVTLRKSGALERGVQYVAIGTKIRVVLGVFYAKYQIGKRRIFPGQGAVLPVEYTRALQAATVDVCRVEMGRQ